MYLCFFIDNWIVTSMLKNFAVLALLAVILGFTATSLQGQTTDQVRVMHYNLLFYGQDNCRSLSDKNTYFQNIFNYYKPDVITANELVPSKQNANSIRNNVLNTDGRTAYKRAKLTNQANSGIVNMLYYNSNKVGLAKQLVSNDELRDINHYKLYHKPGNLTANSDTTYFWVATMHLKAGDDGGDATLRDEMATQAMGYAQRVSATIPYLMTGDMNLQNSQEEAYQVFTDPPRSEWYPFHDPLDQEGFWHDNSRFANTFTQSTRTGNLCDGGASGGMDDRFDLILISNALEQDNLEHVEYVPGSYVTAGQDGNRQNGSITDPNNNKVPDRVSISLKNFSDHLPVMLDLSLTTPTDNSHTSANVARTAPQLKTNPNPFHDQVRLSFQKGMATKARLYTATGKLRRESALAPGQTNVTWRTEGLKPGVYILKVQKPGMAPTTKRLIKR
jgi:endonuclease/exonuclease/phosphatase family metal-dependent hydrolase